MLADWSAGWDYTWEMRGMAQNWLAGNLAYLANNKRIILFCLAPFCVHNLMPRGLKGVRFTFAVQNAHRLLGLEGSLWHCWTLILLMLRDDVGRQSRWEGSKRYLHFYWLLLTTEQYPACEAQVPVPSLSLLSPFPSPVQLIFLWSCHLLT